MCSHRFSRRFQTKSLLKAGLQGGPGPYSIDHAATVERKGSPSYNVDPILITVHLECFQRLLFYKSTINSSVKIITAVSDLLDLLNAHRLPLTERARNAYILSQDLVFNRTDKKKNAIAKRLTSMKSSECLDSDPETAQC